MISDSISKKDFRYRIPSEADLIRKKREIDNLVKSCCDRLEMDIEVETNNCLLSNIIIRIDERKDHYQYFHSTENSVMKISRDKEIALLASSMAVLISEGRVATTVIAPPILDMALAAMPLHIENTASMRSIAYPTAIFAPANRMKCRNANSGRCNSRKDAADWKTPIAKNRTSRP